MIVLRSKHLDTHEPAFWKVTAGIVMVLRAVTGTIECRVALLSERWIRKKGPGSTLEPRNFLRNSQYVKKTDKLWVELERLDTSECTASTCYNNLFPSK